MSTADGQTSRRKELDLVSKLQLAQKGKVVHQFEMAPSSVGFPLSYTQVCDLFIAIIEYAGPSLCMS